MRSSVKESLLKGLDKSIADMDADAQTLSRLYLSTLAPFASNSYQLSLAAKAVTSCITTLMATKIQLESARDFIAAETTTE